MKTNLVYFRPPSPNPRDIIEHRTMFPEWTPFNIVDEAHGVEIHVRLPFSFDDIGFGDAAGVWRIGQRALLGKDI